MSVKTLQTLLYIILVVVIVFRYNYSRPTTVTKPISIEIVSEVLESPHTKKSNQIIKLENQIVLIASAYPEYHFGDIIKVKGILNEKQIILRPQITKISKKPHQFLNILLGIREKFEKILDQYLPSDNAALAAGMLLGTTREFSQEIDSALRRTGTMHMIVVSGFNITLVSTGIMKLAGLVPRRIAIVLAIAGTIIFVLLTGAQPPAVRAGMMTGIVLIGQFFGRTENTLRALILTMLLLLVHSPLLLSSLSFQLSCAATLGILLLNSTSGIEKGEIANKWKKYITDELHTSLAAQVAVTPLILNTFGSLSLIAPIANLAVSWSVSYIMLSTLILCLAELITPLLAMLCSFVLYPITAFFLQAILWFSKVPGASLDNIQINWLIVMAIYCFIAIIIIKKRDNKKCSESDVCKSRGNE